ncbi:PhoU domain-containing protein [Candidatus Omnitrophota bacterium]
MENNVSIKKGVYGMIEKAHQMFRVSFDGFMKNDLDILTNVIKEEQNLTEIFNALTRSIVESSKKEISKIEKTVVLGLVDIISDIERIGDCCVSLVERMEYKIREELFFSDIAVEEYRELCTKVEPFLSKTAEVIITAENQDLTKRLIADEVSINQLVEKYRLAHIHRLAEGICDSRASTMYLDMLDFTREIVHHCASIAKQILSFHNKK